MKKKSTIIGSLFLAIVLIVLSITSFEWVTPRQAFAADANFVPPADATGERVIPTIIFSNVQGSGEGLSDSSRPDSFKSQQISYWWGDGIYLDITIPKSVNVWRSGTSTWAGSNAPLIITNLDTLEDVTELYPQKLSKVDNSQWELTIPQLQAGNYRFAFGGGVRIDSEWWLESTEPEVLPSPTPTVTPEPTPTPTPAIAPTPTPTQPTGDRAILTITLVNGTEKEYDLPMNEVKSFLEWYDQRDAGRGAGSYAIDKHDNNKGPFKARKDYVIFDKILTYEVNEY